MGIRNLTRGAMGIPQYLLLNKCNVITNVVVQIEKGLLAEFYLFQELRNLTADVRFAQSYHFYGQW